MAGDAMELKIAATDASVAEMLAEAESVEGDWLPEEPGDWEQQSSVEMIPMIDVTFQLLIFFMFTSALASSAAIEVPEAVHGRGVTPEGKQFLLVDQAGVYYLGEIPNDNSRAESLDALLQEVESNARQFDGRRMDVIVNAHKGVKFLHVRRLVERLGTIPKLGPIKVGVEEKP